MSSGQSGQFPYREARLSDAGDDLTKQWVIVYYIWHVGKKKLVRKRMRIEGDTVEERRQEAAIYIKDINKALKQGYHIAADEKAPIWDGSFPTDPDQKPKDKALTLAEAVEFFLKHKKRTLNESTMMGYESAMRRFTTYATEQNWMNKPLIQITTAHALEYFDYLVDEEIANKTHNNYLLVVGSFFNFYVGRELLKKNPCKVVKFLPAESGGNIPFTQAEALKLKEQMLAKGDHQLWLFCALMYYTFCRPGRELRFLKVGDIEQHTILIRPEQSKSKKGKRVRIPPGLESILKELKIRSYPPNYYVFSIGRTPAPKAVCRGYFYRRHRKHLKAVKMEHHSLYAWKHSGNIAAYLAGADLMYLKDQNGHHSVSQTEQYLKDLGMIRDSSGADKHPTL